MKVSCLGLNLETKKIILQYYTIALQIIKIKKYAKNYWNNLNLKFSNKDTVQFLPKVEPNLKNFYKKMNILKPKMNMFLKNRFQQSTWKAESYGW